MVRYFIACGMALLTPCSATEASLTAGELTSGEKAAGYHVVMVAEDDSVTDIAGWFDELPSQGREV